jgi:hypothetical protein
VSTVLVAGLGQVGVRAARQLLDTPAIERVLVAARDRREAREVASALHDGAEAVSLVPGDTLPDEIDAVASALPGEADLRMARAALRAGVPFASGADRNDTLLALLDLDADARDVGVRVVAGCGLAPGLSDVLARHASDLFDEVDEIQVARFRVAGSASASAARRARRAALEWRDGAAGSTSVGALSSSGFPSRWARECEVVATGVERSQAHPGVDGSRSASASRHPSPALPAGDGLAWGSVRWSCGADPAPACRSSTA